MLLHCVFWSSSRWPPGWAPEDGAVYYQVIVIDRFYCMKPLHWWNLMVVVAFFGANMLGRRCLCLRSTCDGVCRASVVGTVANDVSTSFWIKIIYQTLNDISDSSINTVEPPSNCQYDTVPWSRWYSHINFNVTMKPSHFIQIQQLCTLHHGLINLTWNLSQL